MFVFQIILVITSLSKMSNSVKNNLLDKFSTSFERMKKSRFCVYRNPDNLYENLVNTIAVARKLTRKAGRD